MVMTMLEVAKCVGTSEATVSRVLSGNDYASQEIKDRAFQTVEESGYRLNLLARNLSMKSTQTLGPTMTNTLYYGIYSSELLFHTTRMAGERGWQLLLTDGKHSAEEEHQAVQYLLDPRCDTIMIYSRPLSVDEIDDIADMRSQPIMALNCHLCRNNSHSVQCDHKQTSFNAVAELINTGRQETTLLTDSIDSPTSIECFAEYKDAPAQHGITFNEKPVINGKWTPANGAEGVEILLERGAKFSALVASNDDMAIGTIKALHECGIAVPERVSVIGSDDIATALYTVPTLSGIKILATEMIQEVIGRPASMLDGGDLSPPKTFSGKLIHHDSLIAPSR